jgi:hypothetical protein
VLLLVSLDSPFAGILALTVVPMTPQEAHQVWRHAEEAYHQESRGYFVIRDASVPFDPVQAAAALTALRVAAQAAQDAYVQAVANQATQG